MRTVLVTSALLVALAFPAMAQTTDFTVDAELQPVTQADAPHSRRIIIAPSVFRDELDPPRPQGAGDGPTFVGVYANRYSGSGRSVVGIGLFNQFDDPRGRTPYDSMTERRPGRKESKGIITFSREHDATCKKLFC